MTCAVVLWVLLGTPAGYVAARFYKCKWEAKHGLTGASHEHHNPSHHPHTPHGPYSLG